MAIFFDFDYNSKPCLNNVLLIDYKINRNDYNFWVAPIIKNHA